MSRYRRHHMMLRHMIALLVIPLALTGVGYALFSQELTLNSSVVKPSYTTAQGLRVTYTRTVTPINAVYTHVFSPITITNNGVSPVSAWTLVVTLPTGFTNRTCTNVTCTIAGTTLTMKNTVSNGTINPGQSVSFSMQFRSALTRYTLQNVNLSGTVVPTYQTMPGLTVSYTKGARTKSGQYFRWVHTFTVTNNTGQTINAWRIIGTPWTSATNRVGTMDATVSYTTSTTQLTITRNAQLLNGASFVFAGRLESTNQNWVLTTYPIEGSL